MARDYRRPVDEALIEAERELVHKELEIKRLVEQLESLRETIRHADHFIRQPVDLNYVAIPKDDWEIILGKVSSPASVSDA